MAHPIADGLVEIMRERDRVAALLQSLERRIAECEAESFDLPAAIADAEERGDLRHAVRPDPSVCARPAPDALAEVLPGLHHGSQPLLSGPEFLHRASPPVVSGIKLEGADHDSATVV
jgi:hypothetical protein